MIINCNNKKDIYELLLDKNFIKFIRGSRVYKTNNEKSDADYGIIVPDDYSIIDIEGFDSCEKVDTRIHNCIPLDVYIESNNTHTKTDVQIIKESDFIELIKEHQPIALEAIFANRSLINYRKCFNLDRWTLRESFSSVVNNSWSKAHKKMTIKKDLDLYCGAKSLFHSIRLQKLACQIASGKEPIDFTECYELWKTIKDELESGKDWKYFKEKYKPIYNQAHSEMVKSCPKPREKYKKSTKKKVESDE